MSEAKTSAGLNLQGDCLCGAVKISLPEVSSSLGVCHCSMCRQWGGGPFMSLEAGENIAITGAESVARYASSDWAERAFCKHCGTHLFYRFKGNNGHHVLAGLFGADTPLKLDHQIFIDEKPAYYNFSEQSRNMTGAEVMAMFSGEDE